MDNAITAGFDQQFAQLHQRSCELIEKIPPESLYRQPSAGVTSFPLHSCGEYILRSAASVEQTFGGITSNLWDDPFEWTLPETLPTPEKVVEYLNEVEATRKRGFELFKNDADLFKEIMAPSGNTELLPLLLDTLVRAAHYLGSARAIFELLPSRRIETDH